MTDVGFHHTLEDGFCVELVEISPGFCITIVALLVVVGFCHQGIEVGFCVVSNISGFLVVDGCHQTLTVVEGVCVIDELIG